MSGAARKAARAAAPTVTREEIVFEFATPPDASRCKTCGAAGPVGVADVERCPWCDGTALPSSAVRIVNGPAKP